MAKRENKKTHDVTEMEKHLTDAQEASAKNKKKLEEVMSMSPQAFETAKREFWAQKGKE